MLDLQSNHFFFIFASKIKFLLFSLTAMAFLYNLRLVCPAILMLALHLEFASAAVRVSSVRGKSLTGDTSPNRPDPYVKVWCGSTFAGMTEFLKDTSSPEWTAEFNFRSGGIGDTLRLEVWDKDELYDDHLFTCTTRLETSSNDVTCSSSKGTLYYRYTVY